MYRIKPLSTIRDTLLHHISFLSRLCIFPDRKSTHAPERTNQTRSLRIITFPVIRIQIISSRRIAQSETLWGRVQLSYSQLSDIFNNTTHLFANAVAIFMIFVYLFWLSTAAVLYSYESHTILRSSNAVSLKAPLSDNVFPALEKGKLYFIEYILLQHKAIVVVMHLV